MDATRVGYFICKQYTELLKKKSLKQYIDFQKRFPNAVILFLDYSLFKAGNYAFQCFRINPKLMNIVDQLEIEDDQADIAKKFVASSDLLKNLNFTLIEDAYSLFSSLVDVNYENSNKEVQGSYDLKENLYMRINTLNKMCDKLIDEQKKYINYYKIKKQFGKTKESEFLEMLNKKGNELANLDKIDLSILSKNISNMNERIKSMTDRVNIKNSIGIEMR